MNVTLGDLVASEDVLARLAQEKVSARMSFTLATVLREVGKHLECKRAAHRKLLETYGTPKSENADAFDVPVSNRAAYQKEYQELMDTPVTLAGLGKIRASVLESEGVSLLPVEAVALEWLIRDDLKPLFENN